MQRKAALILLSGILTCFISCKKDNETTAAGSSMTGTWQFIGFDATTASTATVNDQGDIIKTVSTSHYITSANAGTVVISGNNMTGNGISYAANMLVFVQEYDNNELVDTFSSTLPFVIPATNSSSTFEVIGTDSIHYLNAALTPGGSGAPAATGAKFSIASDVLTMTSHVMLDKIIDTLGEIIQQHEEATVVTKLQKK